MIWGPTGSITCLLPAFLYQGDITCLLPASPYRGEHYLPFASLPVPAKHHLFDNSLPVPGEHHQPFARLPVPGEHHLSDNSLPVPGEHHLPFASLPIPGDNSQARVQNTSPVWQRAGGDAVSCRKVDQAGQYVLGRLHNRGERPGLLAEATPEPALTLWSFHMAPRALTSWLECLPSSRHW